MRRYVVKFIVRAEVQVPDGFTDQDMIARCGAAIINNSVVDHATPESQTVLMSNLKSVHRKNQYMSIPENDELGDFKFFTPEYLKSII